MRRLSSFTCIKYRRCVQQVDVVVAPPFDRTFLPLHEPQPTTQFCVHKRQCCTTYRRTRTLDAPQANKQTKPIWTSGVRCNHFMHRQRKQQTNKQQQQPLNSSTNSEYSIRYKILFISLSFALFLCMNIDRCSAVRAACCDVCVCVWKPRSLNDHRRYTW